MNRSSPFRIGVIGCGTAGPAAAALLARQGHEVTLFERALFCRAVGAGFLLQPSGADVLRELGIFENVITHAAKVRRLHIVEAGGKDLLSLRYEDLGPDYYGAGLHRPVLLHYLIRAMEVAGVHVHWGQEIIKISRQSDGWTLGSKEGEEWSSFDLLVVADGVRSIFRNLVSPGADRGYPWGAHWFIGNNDSIFPENELFQVVQGTRRLGGFLATGHSLNHGPALVSLFWSIKVADDHTWRAQPLDDWKTEVRRLCPQSAGLLDQITSWDQVMTARYGDVFMHRWYGDGIVVLGDAAHAMSPQLGQGVNLALQDASCLADCIKKYDLRDALPQYQRQRRLNIAYYQFATRRLTPWFQSDHEWITPLRRVLFRTCQQIPWSRLLMTHSMAGTIGTPFKIHAH